MEYEPVIGLEVHCQLLTESKIFCGCSTRFGAPPNTNVCPICLGMPGTLPVLNRRAVEFALRAALALDCDISAVSIVQATTSRLFPARMPGTPPARTMPSVVPRFPAPRIATFRLAIGPPRRRRVATRGAWSRATPDRRGRRRTLA